MLGDFDAQLGAYFAILEKAGRGETKLSPTAMARGHAGLLITQLPPCMLEQRLATCSGIEAETLGLLKSRGIETLGDFLRADVSSLIGSIGRKAFDNASEAIACTFLHGK